MRFFNVRKGQRKSYRLTALTVLVGLALLSTNLGCILEFPYSYSSSLTVSSDGSIVAYVRSNNTVLSYGGHTGKELNGEEIVRYRPVNQAFGLKSVRVYSYTGASPSGYIEGMLPIIKFSPDSRHLGVLTRGVLSCIDLETSRLWSLAPSDERVTTFSWIGSDEIAYVGQPNNRVFFRHKIDDPPGERKIIHKGAGPAIQEYSFPNEYWSPRGRFVIYKQPDRGFVLLEVHTGVVRSFDAPPAAAMQAAWKHDGSAVLCASYDKNHSPKAAVLIDLRTGESLDLSEQFVHAFTDPFRTELDPDWTPDGKYIIVNTVRRGGFLIQLKPWNVIPIGERLVSHLGRHYEPYIYKDDPQPDPPWIHSFPIVGWMKVDAGGRDYAVDYAVQRLVRLGGWATESIYPIVSALPTGVRIVELTAFGGIKVRNIDLSDAKRLQRHASSTRH